MATLEKRIVDDTLLVALRLSGMEFTTVMCGKNNYAGLPVYILKDSEHIIAAGIVDPDGFPLYAKVCSFEVLPEYRRNGYGRRLLMEIVRDYDDVKLTATREAFDFYRRCGFSFEAPEPDRAARTAYMVARI